MSRKFDRRDFVRFIGGGALGAAVSGAGVEGISRINAAIGAEQVKVPGGPEKYCLSVCSLCEAACSLRVRVIGKRVVRIQGNPLDPVTRGGLCPKGLAGLQELYHPDRLRVPLRNAGTRAKPQWKQISWDEAVAALTRKLRELRDAGQAHTVAVIDRSRRSLSSRVMFRFLAAYGSPNHLTMPSGLDALQSAVYFQQGATGPVAFDWEQTRYVLSFGANLLEGWGSPAAIMRAFGRWRDSTGGRSTKLVQVEPRFSVTAAKADEWLSLRPGTEAALALGIANVLIAEELYDAEFIRNRTFGFDDWRDAAGKTHTGFRSLVLNEYGLNDVSAVTGVPVEKILRVAREFAVNRPAVALGDHQTSTLAGNPYAAMAVHSLNALVGSVDAPGGALVQPDSPVAPAAPPASAKPRVDQSPDHPFPGHHLARLPKAILSRQPYAVNAVLLHEADPVFAMPNGDELRQALHEVPFVACFTPFLNESAALSDLILPVPTGLERWQATTGAPALPAPVLPVSAPVIPPRHRTRDSADIMLEVARGLRGAVAQALPFASVEEYLKSEMAHVVEAQRGMVFGPPFEETWNRLLERSGWRAPGYSNAEELWQQVREKGGWWEGSYPFGEWERVLRTPSGRFEFYSQHIARWAESRPQFARAQGFEPGDDRLCLPHQPPLEKPPQGRLLLLPVEVLPLAGGTGAHLPYLQQIAGAHLFESWESWVEINPETAHKLSIADGDMVTVESGRGRLRARARFYAGAPPGAVHLPLGYGQTEGGEWARRGVNPLRLVERRYEPLTGLPAVWDTYVKVYRS